MDSYSGHGHAFDAPAAAAEPTEPAPPPAIGTDERRMHVRAYNHWVSLLNGRDYPSIEDLDPASIADFAAHSVLLDFTAGRDNPATPYIGDAIRAECDITDDQIRHINQVPSRSLLSRLTDHYLQIIANRAPIGFEAEFVNQRGHAIFYRGILMPFSSDGDTIDFIYGVINWKDIGAATAEAIPVQSNIAPVAVETTDQAEDRVESEAYDEVEAYNIQLEPDAGLADRLWAARESAEVCKQADGRSRVALYRALAMAYDFAVAAKRVPEDYAEILEDAGVKAQARAPMTPIVKLVFGIDYDKTRLTEFAAALSFADRAQVEFGGFMTFVERTEGGLKGLVAAERRARRPDKARDDRAELGRQALRNAPALSLDGLPDQDEFALVITRRRDDGGFDAVCLIDDPALLDRALRRAAP